MHIAESRCSQCHGTGMVKTTRGHMVFSRPCTGCDGSGRRRQARCPTCQGQQVETRSELLTVNIPAGLADGARIRVPGKGHAGRNGDGNGDLYITVKVHAHPTFRREGDDIYVTVPVAAWESALGARIEVPTIDGRSQLKIPPGTQSGQKLRLREKGVPSATHEGKRGDEIVEIKITVPAAHDMKARELWQELHELHKDDLRAELWSKV